MTAPEPPVPLLESYFYLSDRSNDGLLKLKTVVHRQTDVDTQRILLVANALAALCVNQAHGQVLAVAIGVDKTNLDLHIAENREVPATTIPYLQHILTLLKEISTSCPNSPSPLAQQSPSTQQSSKIEEVIDLKSREALGQFVLDYTFRKFTASLMKQDDTWHKRVKEIRSELANRAKFLALFNMIVQIIDVIYALASVYAVQKDVKSLSALWTCLDNLDELVRRSSDKDTVAQMLSDVDYGRDSDILDVIELEDDEDGHSLYLFILPMTCDDN